MVHTIIHNLDVILETLVEFVILFLEFVGVGVVIITGVRGLINYIQKNARTKLFITEGLTMGLEFMLGGEILRTVVARDMSEIFYVGGIIILRVALTLLLHWEITSEKKEEEAEKLEKKAE